MEPHNKHTESASHIVEAIREKHITMKPRWKFLAQGAAFLVAIVAIGIGILYLGSFMFFSLRHSGVMFAPQFGYRGWFAFVRSLPWALIVLLILFMIVLEVLVRRYSFTYRRPLLYSFIGIMTVVIVGSVLLERTPLHPRMMRLADDDRLPIAGRMYRSFGRPTNRDVVPGVITDMRDPGFMMRDSRGDVLSVIMTPQTRVHRRQQLFIGDHVVVVGQRIDHSIQAFGIRKLVQGEWEE